MTLALVAPSFAPISETFIADHVRSLAPGETVLVCRDGRGAERHGVPVLSYILPEPTPFGAVDAKLKWAYFNLRRRFGPPLGYDDRQRVMAFFKAHGVDRVLGEFGYSAALMTDVCRALDLPLYAYFRGMDASASTLHPFMRRRYNRMWGQLAGVFCVSQAIADRVVAMGCPPGLIRVNASGVLVDAFAPGEADPNRLLAVGRLVDKKAPHLTIEAFGRVAARFPDARLDVVGEGPLLDRCRAAIAAAGIEPQVTLHGAIGHAEVQALMSRASVFVQHSMTAANGDIEGFPTAIAEAMSSALAVVSTRHSGIPEHVIDGETGFVVDEGDVAGMAAAIARVLEDPALARRLGAAARARAELKLDRIRSRAVVREAMGLPAPAVEPGLTLA